MARISKFEPLVVELEDDEGVALAADVGRHEVLGAVYLRREVTHVAKVARQAVQPLWEVRKGFRIAIISAKGCVTQQRNTYAISLGGSLPGLVSGRRVAVDRVELGEARYGEEDVQLAGAAFEVEPQLVGDVALEAGQVERTPETFLLNISNTEENDIKHHIIKVHRVSYVTTYV